MERDKNTTCQELPVETLLLYAYRELEDKEAERVKTHVEQCQVCQGELKKILEVRQAYADPEAPAEPSVKTLSWLQLEARKRVHERSGWEAIKAEIKSPLSWLTKSPAREYVTVTAVIALLILAGLVYKSDLLNDYQEPPKSYDIAYLTTELQQIEAEQDALWGAPETSLLYAEEDDSISDIENEPSLLWDEQEAENDSTLSDIEQELQEQMNSLGEILPL